MTIETRAELPGHSRRPVVDWAEAKRILVENEGSWVLIAKNVANSTATQFNAGRNKHFRDAELTMFEFAVRKPEDPEEAKTYESRRTDLWGRYVAPASVRVTS